MKKKLSKNKVKIKKMMKELKGHSEYQILVHELESECVKIELLYSTKKKIAEVIFSHEKDKSILELEMKKEIKLNILKFKQKQLDIWGTGHPKVQRLSDKITFLKDEIEKIESEIDDIPKNTMNSEDLNKINKEKRAEKKKIIEERSLLIKAVVDDYELTDVTPPNITNRTRLYVKSNTNDTKRKQESLLVISTEAKKGVIETTKIPSGRHRKSFTVLSTLKKKLTILFYIWL